MPTFAPAERWGPHVGNPGMPQRPALSVKLKLAPFKSLPPSAPGTLPDKELPLRFNLRNAVKFPRLSGIDPLRKL